MMSAPKVVSEAQFMSTLLLSGHFEVPWHQRYYDWKEEQVRDLLHDLKNAEATDKQCYFLGSIMLLKAPEGRPLRVNDGQQRLITFSLIIAALCRRFARSSSRDAARDSLAIRILFDRSETDTSLLSSASRYQPRMHPPRNDKSTYTQIVRGYDVGTNGIMTAAWNTVDNFVEAMSADTRVAFFDFLVGRVEVSVLTIPSDVDANAVFEALNARGKRLDDVDMIRNHLYSYFSESDDDVRRDTVHRNLENTTVVLRGQRQRPEYYRCALQCRYGYLQKTRFYRDARQAIELAAGDHSSSSEYVHDLARGLGRGDNIELYRTITSSTPTGRFGRHLPKARRIGRSLTIVLRELSKYKVSHTLLYALLHRFVTESDARRKGQVGRLVVRSVNNLASFVMRTAFVAPKFEPSRVEAAFANCAKNVFNGVDRASLDIIDELRRSDDLDVFNDASFVRRMTEADIRNNTKAKRYLFGVNAEEQKDPELLRENACSVEHVLPQSSEYWSGWTGFERTSAEEWVYRTGNMVVVGKRENLSGRAFNSSFVAKRAVFEDSPLVMPRQIARKYDEWTPKVVEARSAELAERAAQVWQFVEGGR